MSGPDASAEADAATAESSDRALARRAGLGDAAAFEELFHRHFAATYRYAIHMLNDEESLAEDATQDAWVKIWRHLPDFRGESSVQTWLFKVVARQVLDARRARRPLVLDNSLLEPISSRASRETDPAKALDNTELWSALSRALVELPWRQRAVWLLQEFEAMSYADIARVLDTTPTVVRGQLHRARVALAIRMEQWR